MNGFCWQIRFVTYAIAFATEGFAGIESRIGNEAATEFRTDNAYSGSQGWVHYVLTMSKEAQVFAVARPDVPRSVYTAYINDRYRGRFYSKYHTTGQLYEINKIGESFRGWLDDFRIYNRVGSG